MPGGKVRAQGADDRQVSAPMHVHRSRDRVVKARYPAIDAHNHFSDDMDVHRVV